MESELFHGLANIQKREINQIAGRVLNTIRVLPKRPSNRKVVSIIEGETVEQDVAGSVFDTVWDENVGSNMCPEHKAWSLATAKWALIRCAEITLGEEFSDDRNITAAKELSPYRSRKTMSYRDLGYTLDVTTIGDLFRDGDVYEFWELLSNIDVPAFLYKITKTPSAVNNELRDLLNDILDIAVDIAKITFSLSAIDLTNHKFDPAGWNVAQYRDTVVNDTTVVLETTLVGRKTGLTQIAIDLPKSWRLDELRVNDSSYTSIDFALAEEGSNRNIILSDAFYPSVSTMTATMNIRVSKVADEVTFPVTNTIVYFK